MPRNNRGPNNIYPDMGAARGAAAPPPYIPCDETTNGRRDQAYTDPHTSGFNQNSWRGESSPLNGSFPQYGYQAEPPRNREPRVKHDCRCDQTWAIPRQLGIMMIVVFCVLLPSLLWQISRVSALSHRLAMYPPTRAELDALKAEWLNERMEQKRDYDQWARDRVAFEEERRAWGAARKEHELDKDNWTRERRAYDADTQRWHRAMEDYEFAKKQWAAEQEGFARERLRMQKAWKEEQEGWARERLRMQKAWKEEQEGWAREREERERGWREEADRHRVHEGNVLGLSWGQVESHQCVRFGTREYTARLGFDRQEACQHMPVILNGAPVAMPHECMMEGDTLVGRWNINEGETACRPNWGDVYDKGCVGQGSGKHRFEARLWDLHGDEDWMTMCSTTPADVRGHHFDGPTHCENRGVLYGMVGMWDVDDDQCW